MQTISAFELNPIQIVQIFFGGDTNYLKNSIFIRTWFWLNLFRICGAFTNDGGKIFSHSVELSVVHNAELRRRQTTSDIIQLSRHFPWFYFEYEYTYIHNHTYINTALFSSLTNLLEFEFLSYSALLWHFMSYQIVSYRFILRFTFFRREMRLVSDTLNECFEPLILPPVSVQSLQRWGKKSEEQLRPTDYSLLEKPRHRASPFPCSDQVNNRFIIW